MNEISGPFPRIVATADLETLAIFGPTLQFMVSPLPSDDAPCLLRGIIPPGVSVPLHSHPDMEAFFVVSGTLEFLSERDGKVVWMEAGPGNLIEVPPGAKHAFRNRSSTPAIQLITTTSRLGRFFQKIGTPISGAGENRPPTGPEIEKFVQTAQEFGYWLATPEENAEIGIVLFEPAQ